jgi:hypothetical protein
VSPSSKNVPSMHATTVSASEGGNGGLSGELDTVDRVELADSIVGLLILRVDGTAATLVQSQNMYSNMFLNLASV